MQTLVFVLCTRELTGMQTLVFVLWNRGTDWYADIGVCVVD